MRFTKPQMDISTITLSFTLIFAGVFLLRYALETLRDAADARERRATT